MPFRVWNLVWKEIIQFARDRLMTAFIFTLPLIQLALLAQATERRIGDLKVVVLDQDRSAVTRALISDLDNREELAVHYYVDDLEQLQTLLDQGKVDAGVVFPRGLARDLADPARAPQVQVLIDGSNAVVGGIASGAVSAVFSQYEQEQLQARGLATAPPIDLRITTYYNPTYNTRYFAIPAQVGFIIYQITLAVASLGLARERELGTLEQLIVTPLSRLELVLGKAIPAFIIGVVNFIFLLGVTVHVFGVPMRGSVLLLLFLTLPFIVAEIGWGVLISAGARTQQQAILLVFILAMVDISFSGFLVPVKNLPGVLQWVAQAVPMYHYLVIIRSVMLKGATLSILWPHAVALFGLAGAILSISVRGVSRRLD
ncbi:MAG TPA: ABC transporter permease [Thermoflexia bacterium]|jgi:ABC-2 type transport system permease protein|nr:ABC transporter permease [Thermoflexia bacterium]